MATSQSARRATSAWTASAASSVNLQLGATTAMRMGSAYGWTGPVSAMAGRSAGVPLPRRLLLLCRLCRLGWVMIPGDQLRLRGLRILGLLHRLGSLVFLGGV